MAEKYSGIVAGNKITAKDMENALDGKQDMLSAVQLNAIADVANKQPGLPIGTILMHTGIGWVNNDTLPGWYMCDGNNNTPNLTNKFVRGGVQSTLNGQAINSISRNGGNDMVDIKLEVEHLPPHSHSYTTPAWFIHELKGGNLVFAGGLDMDDGLHTTNTENTGNGETYAIQTIPAYYAVIYIMRVN